MNLFARYIRSEDGSDNSGNTMCFHTTWVPIGSRTVLATYGPNGWRNYFQTRPNKGLTHHLGKATRNAILNQLICITADGSIDANGIPVLRYIAIIPIGLRHWEVVITKMPEASWDNIVGTIEEVLMSRVGGIELVMPLRFSDFVDEVCGQQAASNCAASDVPFKLHHTRTLAPR